jgi:hypothetical protein
MCTLVSNKNKLNNMKNFKKDLIEVIRIAKKSTMERLKLLVMFIITIGALGGGLYGGFVALTNAGGQILMFLLCVVWVWFGVGMLDLFRDMYNYKR